MRTFLLGLGAQKAGTTWLFKQLIKSSNFVPGLCKEYHLFDYLHLGNHSARQNAAQRISNFEQGDPMLNLEQKIELIDSFYASPSNYYNYINKILSTDSGFTSDISPSYAFLEASVLAQIKNELALRNINLKVIFIMREPVTRLESEIRMALKRNNTIRQATSDELSIKMEHRIMNSETTSQGNYVHTVNQLDQVFSEGEVFTCFYEDLFTSEELERLAYFMDVPKSIFEPEKVINTTSRHFRYSVEKLEHWREYYEPQYSFVERRFNFDIEKWRFALKDQLASNK